MVQRHLVLALRTPLVAGLICLLAPGTEAQTGVAEVPIRWTLEQDKSEQVVQRLQVDGSVEKVEAENVRAAPVFILIGVALLPSLVDSLITFYRDIEIGGVLIDACGEQLSISNNESLPYGVILMRTCDGIEFKTFRSTPSPPDLSAAIAEIAKSVGKE